MTLEYLEAYGKLNRTCDTLRAQLTAAQNRIKELKAQAVSAPSRGVYEDRIVDLRAEKVRFLQVINEKCSRIADLQSRLLAHELRYREMRGALDKYADKENWIAEGIVERLDHFTMPARKALASPLPTPLADALLSEHEAVGDQMETKAGHRGQWDACVFCLRDDSGNGSGRIEHSEDCAAVAHATVNRLREGETK